jgi:hypothetical protein
MEQNLSSEANSYPEGKYGLSSLTPSNIKYSPGKRRQYFQTW